MSPRYLIHQQDKNAKALIAILEAHGATCRQIDQPVDYVICYEGQTAMVEIKQPKAKLRPNQEKFLREWPGLSAVVRTEDDALELLRRMRTAGDGERDWRL